MMALIFNIFILYCPSVFVHVSSAQSPHLFHSHYTFSYVVIISSTTGGKQSTLPISCGKLSSRFSSRSRTLSRFRSPIVDGSFCTTQENSTESFCRNVMKNTRSFVQPQVFSKDRKHISYPQDHDHLTPSSFSSTVFMTVSVSIIRKQGLRSIKKNLSRKCLTI